MYYKLIVQLAQNKIKYAQTRIKPTHRKKERKKSTKDKKLKKIKKKTHTY